MSGWAEYALAWALFLVTHMGPLRPKVRSRLVAWLGRSGFAIAYSLLSVIMLAALFVAAARAPHIGLWPMPSGAYWLVLGAMLVAVAILSLTLGRPNPFSFGGAGNARFDPDRPELLGRIRHPVLLALALWAGAHLGVNGTLAHALMFGGLAAFALLGMRLIDRRKARAMGAADWARLRQRAAAARMTLPAASGRRLALGIGGLFILIALHEWIAGVAIWPHFLP